MCFYLRVSFGSKIFLADLRNSKGPSQHFSKSFCRLQTDCLVFKTSELAATGDIPSLDSFIEAFDLQVRRIS